MNYKILTTLLALFIHGLANGQQKKTHIPPCLGNNQQTIMGFEQSLIFNQVGINLSKYDWSNPTINCHINSTIADYKRYHTSRIISYSAMGLGVSTLASGIIRRKAYKNNPFLPGTGSDGSGLIAVGLMVSVGGVYTFSLSNKKKKSGDFHLNVVSQYYRDNKLFE